MIALGDVWVVLGTTCLALALEMIWFSSMGFGSWLNRSAPAELETYTIKRLTVSFLSFLVVSSLISFGLSLGLVWWQLLLIGAGITLAIYFSIVPRRPLALKTLMAEAGFIVLLLTVTSYVIAAWPW